MLRALTLVFSLFIISPLGHLMAQDIGVTKMANFPQKRKKAPPITEEFGGGFRLNTDGWSVFAERGFINRYEHKTGFIWMDFSEKKHSKEDKQLNETYAAIFPEQPAPLPYKYGKINNFYQLKFGYGEKRALTGKLDKKNVVIHWTYAGGVSLGMLKPYYLEVLVPEGNNTYSRQFVSYNDEDKRPYFLDDGFSIVGGSFFTKGIGELKVRPGLTARTGFYFDYTPTENSFLGIEIGASFEAYPQAVPIMAITDNKATFLNLYMDVRYGQRWSKY